MAGPWEDFQQPAQKPESMPWEDFAKKEPKSNTEKILGAGGGLASAVGKDVSQYVSTHKSQLVDKAISAIPYATGLGGMAVGSLAGGPWLGGVPGGGAGYAAGKELEKVANHYVHGAPLPQPTVSEAKDVGGNLLTGAAETAALTALGPMGRAAGRLYKAIPGPLQKGIGIGAGYMGVNKIWDKLHGGGHK